MLPEPLSRFTRQNHESCFLYCAINPPTKPRGSRSGSHRGKRKNIYVYNEAPSTHRLIDYRITCLMGLILQLSEANLMLLSRFQKKEMRTPFVKNGTVYRRKGFHINPIFRCKPTDGCFALAI